MAEFEVDNNDDDDYTGAKNAKIKHSRRYWIAQQTLFSPESRQISIRVTSIINRPQSHNSTIIRCSFSKFENDITELRSS